MHPIAWLALAIGSEVIATTSLKLSDGFTRPIPVIAVVAGYAISFYALSISLRSFPLGVVYAIWSGVGTAAIVVIGFFLFREALDTMKLGGIGLVIVGIALLNGTALVAR
jgi:small multidrug resistance pump